MEPVTDGSVRIKVNGREIRCGKDFTVLQACQAADIRVPTLCWDERLAPYGGCRLCLVEVKGMPRPLASCSLPVQEGMEVVTESDTLTRLRRTNLSLILSNHPEDCMLCEKTGDCALQNLAYEYKVKGDIYAGEKWNFPIRHDNPLISYDPNKCILCARCTNICQDHVMAGTIEMTGRGFYSMPDTAYRRPRTPEICTFCGQCVSTCPVGALTERPSYGKGRSYEMNKVRTTCPYCGTGCTMYLNVKDGKVVKVTSDYRGPVNRGDLCIKGRFGYEFIHHPDRLSTPLIRENGGYRQASWDEALDLVARRFTELIEKHGRNSVGAFASSRCTNEENYLVAKWVRAVLGNNNVDNVARV